MIANKYFNFLDDNIYETLSIFLNFDFLKLNFQLFDNKECFKIIVGSIIKINDNHSFEINFNEKF